MDDLENNSGNKPKGVLNFEEIGKIIAVIKDEGDDKKKKSKSNSGRNLYVADNKTATNEGVRYPEYDIELPSNQRFQYCVDKNIERQIVYIAGASGSGKSYWCKQFLAEYHKVYPSRSIYMFSALDSDITLDSLKYMERVKISDELLNEDFKSEDFADSLCIFDDCDALSNKKLRKKILEIQNTILTTGRHYNVSCLINTHTPCAGFDTKLILNECHACVIFPAGLGGRAKSYLLETYLGLDKLQIKKLKNIDSRSICFIKGYPQVVLAERNAYILTDIDK